MLLLLAPQLALGQLALGQLALRQVRRGGDRVPLGRDGEDGLGPHDPRLVLARLQLRVVAGHIGHVGVGGHVVAGGRVDVVGGGAAGGGVDEAAGTAEEASHKF